MSKSSYSLSFTHSCHKNCEVATKVKIYRSKIGAPYYHSVYPPPSPHKKIKKLHFSVLNYNRYLNCPLISRHVYSYLIHVNMLNYCMISLRNRCVILLPVESNSAYCSSDFLIKQLSHFFQRFLVGKITFECVSGYTPY